MKTKNKVILTVAVIVLFIVFYETIIATRDIYEDGVAGVIGLVFVALALILFNFIWKMKPPKEE